MAHLLVSLSSGTTLGGVETVAVQLIRDWLARGHRITAAIPPGPTKRYLESALGVPCPHVYRKGADFFTRTHAFVRQTNPDLIFSFGMNVPLAIAAGKEGVPIVQHVGGVRPNISLGEEELGLGLALTTTVLVPSRFVENDLSVVCAINVRVIPNGTPLSKRFPVAGLKSLLGIPRDCLVIGYSARHCFQKNQRELVSALAELNQRGHNPHLLLVGRSDDRSSENWWKDISEEIRTRGLSDSVHFVCCQPEQVASFLSLVDIFAFPAVNEGLGCALLEAMAMGIPSVACEEGGQAEAVSHGESGFLYPSGNVGVLVEYTERLLVSRELRDRLGRAARETVEKKFSVEQMCDAYHSVISELAMSRSNLSVNSPG